MAQDLDSARVEAALASVPARRAQALRDFYADRAYRAVWTLPTRPGPAAYALREALTDARADGLPTAPYTVPDAACARGAGGLADRAACEVAHAAALLRFAEALRRGRLDPSRTYLSWEAARPAFDAGRVLRAAAEAGPGAAVASARPPFPGYARLRTALARYRALAGAGGWPAFPGGRLLRPGDEADAVLLLRARLRATGDLSGPDAPYAPDTPSVVDAALEQAVRRFQARHGLAVDGIVGPATGAALSVPAADRVRQLELAMERWRWLGADPASRYLLVNVAGQTLDLVEPGAPTLRLRTIVGTRRDPTPAFSSTVTHAVFSPYWHVPASIAREEIWPRVRRDAGYLARHHLRILPNGGLRQDPGPDNPLGPVKFIFANRFGVRLHGTSQPALFEAPVRAFSHGCIRVERPIELAVRLLHDPAWDEARARDVVAGGAETWVALDEPAPLHVGYWTAWVEPDGAVHFRADLYGHDATLGRALERLGGGAGETEAPPQDGGRAPGPLAVACEAPSAP